VVTVRECDCAAVRDYSSKQRLEMSPVATITTQGVFQVGMYLHCLTNELGLSEPT